MIPTETKGVHAMLPALEAILGHRSAHSFATGPVIAEPGGENKYNSMLDRVGAETFTQFNPFALSLSRIWVLLPKLQPQPTTPLHIP